jgi:hypothetical protein
MMVVDESLIETGVSILYHIFMFNRELVSKAIVSNCSELPSVGSCILHTLVVAISSGSSKGRERAACVLAHAAIDPVVKRLAAEAPTCAVLLPLMDASAPAPLRQCCSCIVLGLCADDAAKKTLLQHSPSAPQHGRPQ